MKSNSNVKMLAVLSDPNDDEQSEYRFLVDDAHVRYVTLDGGLVAGDDRTYGPVLLGKLPVFPPGDWNEGRVRRDEATGKPCFCETRRSSLPGIGNIWHGTMIDHLELHQVERVRQTLHRVTHPSFDRPVLAKFAQFPWEIPYFAAETTSYEWIHGRGIGPAFLGHIHENGRVIGFLLEEVPGARTAEPGDLAACQRSLQKLHELGILHGDINKHNFLIRGDGGGEAVLIDFETAQKCTDQSLLDAEYTHIEESLADTSGRGVLGWRVIQVRTEGIVGVYRFTVLLVHASIARGDILFHFRDSKRVYNIRNRDRGKLNKPYEDHGNWIYEIKWTRPEIP